MSVAKTIYIFTGGNLHKNFLSFNGLNEGIIIGVDKGAEWLIINNIVPNYFVGDFDSTDDFFIDKIKREYPKRLYISSREKDETDTDLAIKIAASLEPEEIIIFGGVGSRIDHVIGNIHSLIVAEESDIKAYIYDSNNKIQLVLPNKKTEIEKGQFKYVSLIPFSESVTGINIVGFKYPINNKEMHIGQPYGISNELIDKKGTISIDKGILIVIESKD